LLIIIFLSNTHSHPAGFRAKILLRILNNITEPLPYSIYGMIDILFDVQSGVVGFFNVQSDDVQSGDVQSGDVLFGHV
jgi:hypothetical protein